MKVNYLDKFRYKYDDLNDDGEIRQLMITWMRKMAGMIDGSRDATYGPYEKDTMDYKDLNVSQLTKKGESTISYKLKQAWPVSISDIGLDWGTEGFQEFTVTWRYDYFLQTTDKGNSEGETDVIAAAPVTP